MPLPSGSVLFMDSPDSQAGDYKWDVFSPNTSTVPTPWSGDSYRCHGLNSASQEILAKNLTPTASVLVSFIFQLTSYDDSGVASFLCFYADAGVTKHSTLVFPSDGSVRVRRGTATDMGAGSRSVAGVIQTGVWHHMQVRSTLDDSTGRYEVWVDGAKVIDFTGDTKNGGTATDIDRVSWGGGANSRQSHYADIIVCDSTTPIGPSRVHTLLPNGVGNSTQLSKEPDSGDNYEKVNEANPDDDSTYVYGDTEGLKDTYAMSDLDSDLTVLGVQATVIARRSEAGTRYARPVIRTGGADFEGTSKALAESFIGVSHVWDENPDTETAWDASEVDAIEVGAELRDS